ncbi:type I-E CRISPR-associated protein Cse2/CasB [Kitasatospora sp. NPDC057738]|uniref:type I-E CRISPR-associated protein Cse2/CasB n=1 Tax=Kitasatospora sp. NPDC057738 TaxID=3346233 RepID=UPI00369A41A0
MDPLFLSGLRKDERSRGAIIFAYARQEGTEEVYWGVSRLFAHFNRETGGRLWLNYGAGSMGSALARLSQVEQAQHSARVYMDALLHLRAQLPWRDLMRACVALREHGIAPPDWRELILDLSGSSGPRREVHQRWADDFYSRP